MSDHDLGGGAHGVERTITLTDAVVAIAMTLLVLPLVDLAPDVGDRGLGSVLDEHQDVFLSFVLSFLVIYAFWVAHQRAFASVRQPVPGLQLLNMLWLLVVAFLPFPTAVVGRAATDASVPVYIATMFVLSALTSAMTQLAWRSQPEARSGSDSRWRVALIWTTTGVFGLCAVLGGVNADLGLYGLLLLVLVRAAGILRPRLSAVARTPSLPEPQEDP
jgi:uncharacterized membrane protein